MDLTKADTDLSVLERSIVHAICGQNIDKVIHEHPLSGNYSVVSPGNSIPISYIQGLHGSKTENNADSNTDQSVNTIIDDINKIVNICQDSSNMKQVHSIANNCIIIDDIDTINTVENIVNNCIHDSSITQISNDITSDINRCSCNFRENYSNCDSVSNIKDYDTFNRKNAYTNSAEYIEKKRNLDFITPMACSEFLKRKSKEFQDFNNSNNKSKLYMDYDNNSLKSDTAHTNKKRKRKGDNCDDNDIDIIDEEYDNDCDNDNDNLDIAALMGFSSFKNQKKF